MTKEQFTQVAEDAFEAYENLSRQKRDSIDQDIQKLARSFVNGEYIPEFEAAGATSLLLRIFAGISALIPAKPYLELKKGKYTPRPSVAA